MMRIGVVGCVGIGVLALRTLDQDQYAAVVMEPRTPCGIPKIRTLRRMARYSRLLRDVDAVMFVYPEGWTPWAMRRAKARGKKTMVFWIGTDVYERMRGVLPLKELDNVDLHLCVGERLRGELADLGIAAKCLHVPSDLPEEYSPMPKEHAVLLNIPDSRPEFYGYSQIVRLIQDFPETNFIATRSETPSMYRFPNIDFRGMLSREGMERAFADSSVYIRIPEHDSISLTILEALIKGRQVICNSSFPHTHEVHTYQELRDALSAVLKTPPKHNTEGHDYALFEFSQQRCRELLSGYLDELFSKSGQSSSRHS